MARFSLPQLSPRKALTPASWARQPEPRPETERRPDKGRIRTITHGNLTWIDLPDPTPSNITYLEENFPFHPLDFDDLSSRRQRPKLDEYDDYLFLVLQFPVYDKDLRVTTPSEVDIFVGPDFLITIHKGRVWPLDRYFEACEGSEKMRDEDMSMGSGYLLYRIIDQLVDNFFPIVYKIERNVQEIEDMIFTHGGRETVEEISVLRRDIIAYRRIVKPLMPVISRLEYIKSRLIHEDLEVYFSDIGDHLARVWESLEDQKGIIEALNDTHDSLISHRTNEVIQALTIISVIILPLTLVSGLYGMNVRLPLGDWAFAFEAILALMGFTALAMLFFFKSRRWI
jgi:magnesium transporter